jgi:RNA polymerase sigma-70 factor (ECF subfamily)
MQSKPNPLLSPDLSDAELARRVSASQPGAFELLMRRYNQALFRTARSILHNDSDAEEVLQEAYLQAFRAMDSYRSDARLATWLTRIVIHAAIARARQRPHRAEVVPLEGLTETQPEAIEQAMNHDLPESLESPERAAMRGQMRQLLEQAIDRLPDTFRTVFVLRAVEEMSGEEVATCLDIPEATVRSWCCRAVASWASPACCCRGLRWRCWRGAMRWRPRAAMAPMT